MVQIFRIYSCNKNAPAFFLNLVKLLCFKRLLTLFSVMMKREYLSVTNLHCSHFSRGNTQHQWVIRPLFFMLINQFFRIKDWEKYRERIRIFCYFFFGVVSLFLVKNEFQGIIQVSWAECDFQQVVSYFFRSEKIVLRRHTVY